MEKALENRDYCGTACSSIWACETKPCYTPFLVACCRPCVIGVQYEETQQKGHTYVCPSTLAGCVCCLVASHCFLCIECIQAYIDTSLVHTDTSCAFLRYIIWNICWPCTCGPCISYNIARERRPTKVTTDDFF